MASEDSLTTIIDLPDAGDYGGVGLDGNAGDVLVASSISAYSAWETREDIANKAMLEVKVENIELRKRLEKLERGMEIILKSGKGNDTVPTTG